MSSPTSAERMVPRLPLASQRSPRARLALAALAGIGLSTLLGACSAGPRGERREAIADGAPDVGHEHVFLLVRHDDNSGGLCTATLIAPNLLLTARHCVSPRAEDEHVLCGDSPLSTPFPAASFFATNDARPSDDSPVFRAAEVRVPRDEVDTCGYDIALLILARNVPRELAEPAVPRIDRDVVPGELYTAVGYGVDERGEPTGRRMQRAGLSVVCEPGTCGDGVEASEFRGETGICSGDSGGPALDEDGKVVGVVSRGGEDCGTPVYGTVTAWQTFLSDTAKDAAALGGYEPPFWATTGLSDPPVVAGEGGAGGGGGAGSAGEPTSEEPELLGEGEECHSRSSCGGGLACYAATAGGPATCTRTCEKTSDCAAGQVCRAVEERGVCVLPSEPVDEAGGCSVSRGSSARASADLAWLFAACCALSLRRRRGR